MSGGSELAVFVTQILNVGIILLLIAVPAAIIMRLTRVSRRQLPLDILKQRLAHGKIDETEYLRLRALLHDETPEKMKRTDDTMQAFAADGDTLDADSFDDRRRLRGDWPK